MFDSRKQQLQNYFYDSETSRLEVNKKNGKITMANGKEYVP